MPKTFYSEEEFTEAVDAAKARAYELAQKLSAKVSRAEFADGIGGFGCIHLPGAESEYCFGCPAADLCPSTDKRWPQ